MSNVINLGKLDTTKERVDAAMDFLLEHGFTVIRHSDKYFDFMYNEGEFGHFTINTFETMGFDLITIWKPCRNAGTGAGGGEPSFEFTIDNFINVAKSGKPSWVSGPVTYYKDLVDFVNSSYWKDKGLKVHYPDPRVPDREVS